MKKKLRSNKGSAAVFSVVVCLIIIFAASAIFEYMQMLIIAVGVRNAIESACVSAVTANYDEAYSQLREGYSGGYLYQDTDFIESLDVGDVYGSLDKTLGLTIDGDKHIKYKSGGVKEYTLSDMRLVMENTSIAQGDASRNLNMTVNIKVEVPVRYGGRELLPAVMDMRVKASYMPKF